MNAPGIINRGLFPALIKAGFFPMLATIQQPQAETVDSIGFPTTPFATGGLVAITCYVSQYENRIGDERRTPETTFASRQFHVHLAGAYPQITEKMQVIVSSPTAGPVTYDILSVYVDSQTSYTKLLVQVIQ